MTSMRLPATAEWALWGKRQHDADYRILACSEGRLNERAFEAILARYSPGTLAASDLPQATFSWARDADDRFYVGLAIYEGPAAAPRDAVGREVLQARYFCIPYADLAANSASYSAIYETFRDVRLPAAGRRPIREALNVGDRPGPAHPAITGLAARAAVLLLRDRPVCIVGADQTNLGERLRFLDLVMSMLPYGLRSRMSASTWASTRHRRHHLRLFFADHQLDDEQVVKWRQPLVDADLLREPYAEWLLENQPQSTAMLATLTDPRDFRSENARQILQQIRSMEEATPHRPLPRPEHEPAEPAAQLSELHEIWSPRHEQERRPTATRSSMPAQVTVQHGWWLLDRWLAGVPPKDWVSRAVRDAVQQGLLVFNPPEEMTQGRSELIEVSIARSATLRTALAAGLDGRGQPQFHEVDTSSYMTVKLRGREQDSFGITSDSPAEQPVHDITRWRFDVQPRRAGQQTLILSVWMRLKVGRTAEIDCGQKDVLALRREIKIKVNMTYSVRQFFLSNWKFLIGTAIGGGGLAAWIDLFH